MLLITFCKGCALHGLLTTSSSCGGSGEAIKGHSVLTTSSSCGGSGETIKGHRVLTKILKVVQITATILLIFSLHVAARSVSQTITLSGKNIPLKTVFAEIEKQSGYLVVSNKDLIDDAKPVSINVTDYPLLQFLDETLTPQGLGYVIENKTIFLKKQEQKINTYNKEKNPPVSGIIRGPDGQPLSGVNVMIKGTKKGTVTDKEGRFSIEAEEGAELEISSIGFGKKIVAVSSSRELFVSLEIASSVLDEVQYIAYGQTTKRFSTGNIGTVKAADIEKQPVQNPLLTLQGRVPGLLVTQSTGLPGTGVKVRIQGENSIASGSDPLYVIDGIPYISQLPFTLNGILGESGGKLAGNGSGNPLSFINPGDIESIEILKDADATAIFGSRAANGAILITTKRGKAGRTKVEFNVQKGWGKVSSTLKMLNTEQYIQMRHEALSNSNLAPDPNNDFDLLLWDTTRFTDWQQVLVGGTAHYTDVRGSISGGSENTQFLIAPGYHKETTVFPGDLYDKKLSMHFSINNKSNNGKFKAQLSGSYLFDESHLIVENLMQNALFIPPNAPPVYDTAGNLNWAPTPSGTSSWTNPLAFIHQKYNNKTHNLISNASISYQIWKGLEIKGSFGFNGFQSDELNTTPLSSLIPEERPSASRVALYGINKISSWIMEPQVLYKSELGKGKLSFLIGTTFQQTNSAGEQLRGSGYNSDLVMEDIKSATSILALSSNASTYKYTAIFGRVNYNLLERYIINVGARRDGSSRFGPDNRFHNFGSIGIAWIFSNERFFTNNSFFSFGKLKGSFGTTGNDQIGDYRYINQYVTSTGQSYQDIVGLRANRLYNPYLQWEETQKLQFGVELGFLNDRIILNTNYYKNRSSNQLLSYNLPVITGFGGIDRNFPATVQNSGLEMSISTINVRSKDFYWNTIINLTLSKNELVEFPNLAASSYGQQLVIGQPTTLFQAYEFSRVNPTTGLYEFIANDKSVTISPDYLNDRTILVNTAPVLYGGLENSIKYKGFQLDFLFQFVKQKGQNYYVGNMPGLYFGGFLFGAQPDYILDRWQKSEDNATIQMVSADYPPDVNSAYNSVTQSNLVWADASYIRLKNFSFSYQIPQQLISKKNLVQCKIYFQGQNLLTITNYKGLDPETGAASSLPPLRILTFGIQLVI